MAAPWQDVEWKETSWPGIGIHFLRSDRETGDATVLIRMDPGCGYPQHVHNGAEEVYVLQGAYRDENGTYPTGTYIYNEGGSVHHPVALEGDEPCILFAVANQGITILEESEGHGA